MKDTLDIAVCQISPVWLKKKETLEKIRETVYHASEQGADIAVFGETLLPGYPFWIEHTQGAQFESNLQKEIYAHYLHESVDLRKNDLERLQELCKERKIRVILGTVERSSDNSKHSVYCTAVMIGKDGSIENRHRKLMPTYEERLFWAQGDGSGLQVISEGDFHLGVLNCWENWMPLARTSLYEQGENVHFALWPGNVRNTEEITRFIARESRSYVISCSGLMSKSDIPGDLPFSEIFAKQLPNTMANGGSCVAGPDGEWVLKPVESDEGVFMTTIELKEIYKNRHNFDPTGHYSRKDVFTLQVNTGE